MKEIRRDKNGKIDEELHSKLETAAIFLADVVGYAGMAAIGSPVAFMTIPTSNREQGNNLYFAYKAGVTHERHKKEREEKKAEKEANK